MKRRTLQRIVHFLVDKLTHTTFIDAENVPVEGGVIVAINHMSHLDTPIMMVNPTRPDITGLVTTKYQKRPLIKWFTETGNGIWINRDIADFTAVRKAAEALEAGCALGIAPEGTRSQDAHLQKGKPGTIMLAMKSRVPIVPAGITGTEDAIDMLKKMRKPRITVRFGEPFTLPEFEPRERSEQLNRWTDFLMQRIAELLPEEYRGIYSK